jgi:hypothetical protein
LVVRCLIPAGVPINLNRKKAKIGVIIAAIIHPAIMVNMIPATTTMRLIAISLILNSANCFTTDLGFEKYHYFIK